MSQKDNIKLIDKKTDVYCKYHSDFSLLGHAVAVLRLLKKSYKKVLIVVIRVTATNLFFLSF